MKAKQVQPRFSPWMGEEKAADRSCEGTLYERVECMECRGVS